MLRVKNTRSALKKSSTRRLSEAPENLSGWGVLYPGAARGAGVGSEKSSAGGVRKVFTAQRADVGLQLLVALQGRVELDP